MYKKTFLAVKSKPHMDVYNLCTYDELFKKVVYDMSIRRNNVISLIRIHLVRSINNTKFDDDQA